MNRKQVLIGTAALLISYGGAWAQGDEGDEGAETTIRLMGAAGAELPNAVTKEIFLPESVTEDSAAVEKAASGLATANENRMGREDGLSTADAAREHGAEMAEEAQENRENRGRSEDRPGPPVDPGSPNSTLPPGGA